MKIACSLFSIIPLLLMGNAACTSNKNEGTDPRKAGKEISFSEYSLSGTSSEWLFPRDVHNHTLIIINSDEELAKYITFTGEDCPPPIDFSKFTLLLALGREAYGDSPGITSFRQLSSQHFVMNVNLRPSASAVLTDWWAAMLVGKLVGESNVELHVTKKSE